MAELTEAQYARLAELGDWVFQTCLVFGAQRTTAYKVAGSFVLGLERQWQLPLDHPRRRGRQSRQSKTAGDESTGTGGH